MKSRCAIERYNYRKGLRTISKTMSKKFQHVSSSSITRAEFRTKKPKINEENKLTETSYESSSFLHKNDSSSNESINKWNDCEPEELSTGVKEKLSSLDQHDPLKLRILTIVL